MPREEKLPDYILEPVILKTAVIDRSFFLKIKTYLDTGKSRGKSYFKDEKYQEIFNLISRYYDRTQTIPKKETMKALVKKYKKDEDLQLYMLSIIDTMYDKSDEEDELDRSFVEDEVLSFIKKAKIFEAFSASIPDFDRGDADAVVARLQEAARINFDLDIGVFLKDTKEALSRIKEADGVKTLSTGFQHLDTFLDGGVHPKEIYCFAAIPGGFKCIHEHTKITVKYKKEVVEEIEVGELFKMFNINEQGSYTAPSTLEIDTPLGFKKIGGLLKTQKNKEFVVETKNNRAIFADFHKIEIMKADNEMAWAFVKDLKIGDYVMTRNGWEKVVSVFYNGKESEMYDLNVEDTHSYWAGGFHSHNTGFLTNIALNLYMQGNNVVIYTFETSTERLLTRLYSNISGMSKKEIILDEDGMIERVDNISNTIEGDLIIKEYNANTVSANDIMAHINELMMYKQIVPDAIIVDYLLIMSTNDKSLVSDSSYKYYKTVTEELRNVAKDLDIPIITATQINREGMADKGGSKSTITGKNASESRGIYDTVDVFIPIIQNAIDKKNNRYFLYLDKNRNERAGVRIEYYVDYEHMKLIEKGIN